ncbi:hypothetical protein CFE70_003506 [Pyrenophora teres f. teres 0-1]
MPTDTNSSIDTKSCSYYYPPTRKYRVPQFSSMSSSERITSAEKTKHIHALRSHQVNTILELRRIEKAFAVLGTPDCSEPMTSAYCLDEAKRRVYSDPASNRSWNLCWLVLSKIQTDQLIHYYARYQSSQPTMWAGHTPSAEQITQLTNAFAAEWNWALGQMLSHWAQPPTR